MRPATDVVVGDDGSAPAAEAVRWATDEAARRGAALRVVRSGHRPGPAHELVEASAAAALVVVGSRGRGGLARVLGSVSRRVATRAHCPVVVVRGTETGTDVVVGVDGSPPSRAALAWAAEEARLRDARLRVVLAWEYLLHVGDVPLTPDRRGEGARAALHELVDEVLGTEPPVTVVEEPVCAHPVDALVRAGATAALVVVAPRAASLRARPDLGSVTEQVLHDAPCPVAVVPIP